MVDVASGWGVKRSHIGDRSAHGLAPSRAEGSNRGEKRVCDVEGQGKRS